MWGYCAASFCTICHVPSEEKPSKIIIFDEPLAGLDQKTRKKIIKMIINESINKTLLIITHDKEIIPHMDRVVDINNLNN